MLSSGIVYSIHPNLFFNTFWRGRILSIKCIKCGLGYYTIVLFRRLFIPDLSSYDTTFQIIICEKVKMDTNMEMNEPENKRNLETRKVDDVTTANQEKKTEEIQETDSKGHGDVGLKTEGVTGIEGKKRHLVKDAKLFPRIFTMFMFRLGSGMYLNILTRTSGAIAPSF